MKTKKIVTKLDKKYYKKIRKSVDNIIKISSSIYDDDSILVLDIAPQDHNISSSYFTKASIDTLDIDHESNPTYTADITNNNKDLIFDAKYDIIICTEVLEHTLNPFSAIAEISRLLKPSGKLVVSVPFNFRIHGPLPDCWRFTEIGLRELLKDYKILLLETTHSNRPLMPIHYAAIAEKK